MGTMKVVVVFENFELPLQIDGIPEEDMVKVFTTNGSDQSFNERMRAGRMESSPNKRQLRLHRVIQQINRLLEPLILHERCISLFSRLHRSMTEQNLNVSDGSTSTQ